jgi:hypothetical protein
MGEAGRSGTRPAKVLCSDDGRVPPTSSWPVAVYTGIAKILDLKCKCK